MALDTFSSILGWLNQGTGNNGNSWGDNCDNSIFPIFERAIAGLSSQAVTGGTLALDSDAPPAGPTQALDMIQAFSGTLASDQIVRVPNLPKTWLVYNGCTGAFTLKFKTASGTASAAIPQGGWCFVFCDGGDDIFVGLSTSLRDVQFLGPDGTLALPGHSFASEPGLGWRRPSAGVIAITVGGVDVLTVSATTVTVSPGVATSIVPPGTEMESCAITEPGGYYFEFGQTKPRATDLPLMNAITAAFTANTNGTTVLSNVSVDLRNLGIEGAVLEGVGIFTNATIVSIDSATQITMSNAATNTATGGAVRAFPFGNGDGSTTFTLPDARGTTAVARDNMGGTAKGLVTTAGSGVNGLRLNVIGGVQAAALLRSDLPNTTVAVSISDPGHVHFDGCVSLNINIVNSGGSAQFNYVNGSNAGNTGSAVTGITASFALNGGVTQTSISKMQPSRIRNVIIKR